MLMMPSKSTEKEATRFEIDEIISRFLLSVSDREKFLGLLALLMKIQVEMGKKHSENQEHLVREGISRCEEAVKSSSALRGAFYEHMRIVLQQHKRTEEIRFLSDWSTDLLKRFKNDFFELPPNPESNTDPDSQSTWNLKLNSARLLEIAPMFELIKEIQVLKMRWREEDQDSLTSSYDISVIKNLSFAFEAVLPKDENLPLNRQEKLAQLFFNVQWTRTVLNGFLSQSSVDFLSSDDVSTLSIKNFYVMMDAEKKLAASLVDLATWNVPNLNFGRSGKRDVIVISSEKTKSKKGRKRKSDETTVIGGDGQTNSADVTVNDDDREENLEAEVVKEAPSVLLQLKSHYIPLKLRPIVHLMKLANKKRSALKYLCDELQSVIDTLIKQKKKTPPMLLAARRAAAPTTPNSSKFYHGDSVTIWFCVKKAVEQVWGIVELVFGVFAEQSDASQELKSRVQKDMDDLGEKSLNLIHSILSGELYGGEEKLSPAERVERKSVLIRIIEKKMLSSEHLSNDSEKARVEIGKFLAKSAEFSPTPAVAVAILDVFEDLKLDEDDDAETRKIMAKYALAYLKKDWSKVDELWSKGTRYTCAVRDILHHYIRLRKEKDQLLAIQWILTNKVVQLVPEDDKRKSCVFSQQSDDDLLEKEDRKATFYCISKTTFGVIFKTLFGNLNSRCLKYDMSASAAKNGGVDIEDTLESWETASSCFLILCLLLRINKIRTTAVLTSAIKEGKQFLITVSKKSSFIFLMDNITKGTNFDTICRRVEKILSAVQQGNRVLQSIGTFAKTNKCVLLLKKFPELRAESENCLRVIHSAMVKNECLNAFTVGLVKSRSIDGDIIMDQRASEIDSDSE
ncbi:FANCD2 [Caenorhabditis elegans]|nr:FANCD2 [Caenorhabditis elegans]CBK19501.1 FANCD2 [Caenorhabditis elegans]|eukprot:NP_001255849.1 human FANCD2 (Fanconi's anemia defect) ortholog [Caenorhabditis elegans]